MTTLRALWGALLTIGGKLAMSLATEELARRVLYRVAKHLAEKTESTVDDDIVKYIAESWGLRYPD